MLFKTKGIALSYIKYRETSIIARIFTDAFGMQSYIVNGVRSNKAKMKMALFQPLTLLDLVVYHNKKKEINRIAEIRCSHSFRSLPFSIRKTSIALFITELLGQTLKEEGEQEQLFDFLAGSVLSLDLNDQFIENFHIQFMIHLSRFLGIKPESASMVLHDTGHHRHYDKEFVKKLELLINSDFHAPIVLNKSDRSEFLSVLIQYYQMHYDSIRDFKSVQVLKEVFN